MWLCSYFCRPQNGVHKQNGCGQRAACSEVQAIMRQMSGYWEPTAGGGGGGGHIPAFVGGVHPLSLSPHSFASCGLSFFLSLLQTCEHAHVKTHTHTHSPLTPPPPPLVLIIPLQIRRSISSCIIVPPSLPPSTSRAPLHSSRGERLPFEPLSASLAGVSRFSHSLSANQSSALRQGPIR